MRAAMAQAPLGDDVFGDDPSVNALQEKIAAMLGFEDALFVLETFALDRGMHVVYRGEHSLVEDQRIKHRLAGPASLLERLTPPLQAPWEQALAAALTQCPLGSPAIARSELVTEGAALSLRDMPLYSWIIAPRAVVTARVS